MGAAGVMERGGVAAAGQMTVAVFLGGVSNADVGALSLLQAEARGVRDGIDGEVVFVEAGEAHVTEGKKGLALTFRDELPTAAGRGVDVRSDAFLMGLACAVGMRLSVGLDFFKAAPAAASEEVLVTGVVV